MEEPKVKFRLTDWLKSHIVGMAVFSLVTGIAGNAIFLWMTSPASPSAAPSPDAGNDTATVDVAIDAPGTDPSGSEPVATPAEPLMLMSDGRTIQLVNGRGIDPALTQPFIDWARPEILRVAHAQKEPLLIETTLDLNLERAAAAAIQPDLPNSAAGAVLTLERDGAVRVMVSGANSFAKPNLAVDPLREAGATWRTFVYFAALRQGYAPDRAVVDEPVKIQGWAVPGRDYVGEIDMRTAFAFARDSVTAKLAWELGYKAVAQTARRFGISTPITTDPSMPLGSSKVRMIEMVRAFSVLAAGGNRVAPFGVVKVSTMQGRVIYARKVPSVLLVMAPQAATAIIDLLRSAAASGPARAAQIGRPLAGLAATSPSGADGWFIGFSAGLTTGIWMGRPDGRAVELNAGSLPARAFGRFMRVATAGRPKEDFDVPLTLPEWDLARRPE